MIGNHNDAAGQGELPGNREDRIAGSIRIHMVLQRRRRDPARHILDPSQPDLRDHAVRGMIP